MAPLAGSEIAAEGSVLTAAGSDSPGVTPPPPAATLAAVYAAGVGAPITDDLMVMLHGNMRFQASVDGFSLPALGYFDDATALPTANSSFPAEMWSLYAILGTDESRRFSVYQLFNDTWNGTFAAINGMSWEIERATFTGSPLQKYLNTTPTFAARSWKTLNNWAPAAYPQLTSAHGTMDHEVQMYNTIDGGLRHVDQLDGFGQANHELRPMQNGITWQMASHWLTDSIVGAANDGLGWGIYSGTLDHFNHLLAGLTCRQVTGDPLGDWYWSLFVPDGLGGLLDVADFAAAAITLRAPVTAEAGGLVVSKISGEVDLAAPSTGSVIVPAVAGKTFLPLRVQVFQTAAAGTITGAATIRIQQGAAILVAATSGLTNASAFGFGVGGLIQSAGTQATMHANTDTTVDVTVAATGTGGFDYKAKFILTGFYV